MQQVDTLIHAGQIVVDSQTVLENHSLAIQEGKILAVVSHTDAKKMYQGKEELDLSKHVLMPGLVNAHTHVSMNLLRGLADDLKLMTWLEGHIWPAEAAVISPEFVRDGAMLAMAELIRGGVTTFSDSYFYMKDMAEVVNQVGMRAVLAECFFKFSTPWSPTPDASFARSEDLIEFCKTTDTIYPAVFPHAPYSTDVPLLERLAEFAQKHDLLIHTHLLESQMEIDECLKAYDKRPVQHWYDLGMINAKTIAAHMTHVNDEDLEIFVKAKASVVHCPESNMKLASKVAPVQKMLDMGINVSLATDGAASNNDLDMFGEMKSAAFLSKVSTDNPESLNAQTVVELATLNGAKALHLDQQIGSLDVGKVADIIAIDFDSFETQPCYAVVPQLVYNVPRNNVTHVWVNGKALMYNRKLTTIDEQALMQKAQSWQGKLKQYAKI